MVFVDLAFTCRGFLALGSGPLFKAAPSFFLFNALSSFLACFLLSFSSSICDLKIQEYTLYSINATKSWQTVLNQQKTCQSETICTCSLLCSASLRTSSLKGALLGTPGSFLGRLVIPFFFASFLSFLLCSRT